MFGFFGEMPEWVGGTDFFLKVCVSGFECYTIVCKGGSSGVKDSCDFL